MQIGSYSVQRELARGGMGVVYLARDEAGEPVAIKLLLAGGAASPEQLSRFRREAEALQALDHPGILRVREHGVDGGRLFVVMDYLEGETLTQLVEREGPLTEGRARELAQKIAAALKHAHLRGVVHRDLKPSNVILCGDQPVLVDYGLALVLDPSASRLTESGTIMGSPNYMAPEQAEGEKDVGPAVDLYSLGATLYYLLSGKPPFEDKSTLAILERVVGELPRPLRDLRPQLSPELEAVVRSCLEKHPADRCPTAFALEQALTAPAWGPEPEPAPLTRFPPSALLAVSAALAAVALATLWVVSTAGDAPALGDAAPVSSGLEPDRPQQGPRGTVPPEAPRITSAAELPDPEAPALRELLGRVEDLQQAKRWGQAHAVVSEALELDPDNVEALEHRLVCMTQLQLWDQALADCDRLAQLEPSDPKHPTNRGNLLSGLGERDAAHASYARALELDPTYAEAHYRKGLMAWKEQRRNDALESLAQALEHDPDHVDALLARGNYLANLQRYSDALRDLDRAVLVGADGSSPSQLPPGTIHRVRGTTRYHLEQYAGSVADLERALELGMPAEETSLAQRWLEQARKRVAQGAELRERAQRWHEQRDYPQASLACDEAIGADPVCPGSYLLRGQARFGLEQYAAANEDFGRALELDPELAAAYASRGQCQLALGRPREALLDLERALELGLPAQRAAAVRAQRNEAALRAREAQR